MVAALWPLSALAQPTILKTFTNAAAEGSAAVAPLAVGTDGKLFGATNSGGAYGLGTLFSLNSDGTGFTVLKHLDASVSGYNPNGGVVMGSDGRLYGTMNYGGPTNRGALFAMNADGSGFTILRYFSGADGTYPIAGLTLGADGKLYGATTLDGAAVWGTVFRVNPDGTGYTVLRNFANDADGGQPQGAPVFGSDGRLYGTAYRGGAFGNGLVYAMNPDGSGFTVLRSFAGGADGAQPYTGVAAGADGKIYGTTNFGGIYGGGTVYRLNLDGTGYAILRHLGASRPEGNGPFFAVPTLSGGRLYVTAGFNGAGGAGSVFSMLPDGSDFVVEMSFSGTGKPLSGVRAGPDGRLYGTTREGGVGGFGTIFRLGAPPASPVPSFQGVGDLPGGIFFSEVRDATRVNGVLVAVGGSAAHAGSANIDTAFRWTSSGGMVALPDVVANTTGTNPVMASAITRDGAVIASRARTVATGNGGRVAVKVANQGTANTSLGYLPGNTTYSAATSLSNDGSVLYGFSRTSDAIGTHQAFRWTAAGLTAIPFLAPDAVTNFPAGRGCSADGAVMIGTSAASAATTAGAGNHAYVYVHGHGVAPLAELPGGTWSIGLAVTSDGGILLGTGDSAARPNGELILWDGATTPLGSPDAAMAPSNFGGLSDDGVVVASFFPVSGTGGGAYLRNSHGWSHLEDALLAAGLNLAGWTLDSVLGISPDGTLVFGRGMHNGNAEGWVAELAPGYLAGYFSDHTPPVLTLPVNLLAEATSGGGAAVNFSAAAVDDNDGNVPVNYSIAPGSVFPLGTTTVVVSASDLAGNAASGSFTVTVRDTTAPALALPANLVLEATSPAGAPASYAATATDAVGPVSIDFSVASGAVFPVGTTTVAVTATDGAGNTASGSFTVTVRDTTAPVISVLSASPDTLWSPNNKLVPVTVTASVSDSGDAQPVVRIIAVTCNEPASGDWQITGDLSLLLRATRLGSGSGRIYSITVQAVDAAGNVSTGTIRVTVPHDQRKGG